jgi:hypothetical protein
MHSSFLLRACSGFGFDAAGYAITDAEPDAAPAFTAVDKFKGH